MKALALLPTYNERENIAPLIEEILALPQGLHVLVVDDDSPDGTWREAERLSRERPGRVHLLRRMKNRGRGAAGAEGFRWAAERDYDAVVEMDADFSHSPAYIPAMLEGLKGADLVVASRLIPGGGEEGRHASRRWITLASNLYLRAMLRLPARDCTSGYRCYSRRAIQAFCDAGIHSVGPSIVQETLYIARAGGLKIAEVPFLFKERARGESKLNFGTLLSGLRMAVAIPRLQKKSGRPGGEGAGAGWLSPFDDPARLVYWIALPAAFGIVFYMLWAKVLTRPANLPRPANASAPEQEEESGSKWVVERPKIQALDNGRTLWELTADSVIADDGSGRMQIAGVRGVVYHKEKETIQLEAQEAEYNFKTDTFFLKKGASAELMETGARFTAASIRRVEGEDLFWAEGPVEISAPGGAVTAGRLTFDREGRRLNMENCVVITIDPDKIEAPSEP